MCPDNDQANHSINANSWEGQEWHIPIDRYKELLAALHHSARQLKPAPDCVIGIKRSGLMPAVYISHQMKLPMLIDAETKSFPSHKFKVPLIVDTTSWNGASLRRIYIRLNYDLIEHVHFLVMFASLCMVLLL